MPVGAQPALRAQRESDIGLSLSVRMHDARVPHCVARTTIESMKVRSLHSLYEWHRPHTQCNVFVRAAIVCRPRQAPPVQAERARAHRGVFQLRPLWQLRTGVGIRSSDSDGSESTPESGSTVPFCDAESRAAGFVVAAPCAWAPICSVRVLSNSCSVFSAGTTANAGNEACVPACAGQKHLPLGTDCSGGAQHDKCRAALHTRVCSTRSQNSMAPRCGSSIASEWQRAKGPGDVGPGARPPR
jgi:hypothetical protein